MNTHSRITPKYKVYKCLWKCLAIQTKLLRILYEGLLGCSQWECKMFQNQFGTSMK